jgi:hypothetical protein
MTPLVPHPPFKNSEGGRKASDYNRAFKNPVIRLPQRLENPEVDADLVALADALGLTTIAGQAPDVAGSFDDSAASGSKFTDDTTDFGDAGVGDSLFFPATEEDELDYFLLGHATPFFGLEILLGTNGVGGVVAWEYCTEVGGGEGIWTAFPAGTFFDGGPNLLGDGLLLFAPPEDWAPVILSAEVDATARYYIRARVTTVYTTNPVGDSVLPIEMDATHVTSGYIATASGLVESILVHAVTAGGGNNNTVLLLVNHTKQKRGWYTADNSATIVEFLGVKDCYIEAGDVLSLCVLQEDGTTELQTAKIDLLVTI